MSFSNVWKAVCLSVFFPNISNAQSKFNATATSGVRGADVPRPTGIWISPEYKWFFEYPLPTAETKSLKLTYTNDITNATIDYYEVEIKSLKKQVYPNLPATELIGYDGINPGPTFVMQKGREAVVRFSNNGPTNSSVHLHGSYNRAPFDGWAADKSLPGQYKDYYYPNGQNARTIWYHDHMEYATGEHTYRGQEGFYYITDAEEQSLGLPAGTYDVGLAISAKVYGYDGQLVYNTNNDVGLWGDIIQVNGQPWPYFDVEPRKYRFRLLDGSVSRTYGLSFHEGLDGDNLNFTAIASDGGLFSHPVITDNIAISMGERYEIVVDFSDHSGQNITLKNARCMGENVDYAATDMVMQFRVGTSVSDYSNNGDVPQNLRYIAPAPQTEAVKDFTFARDSNGEWLINGVGFSDVEHRILTRPPRGADEIWTLHNGNGNGTHPIHIHLVDFQVLSRTGGRNQVLPYESAGMKDVVWLAGGETIQVMARYAPWDGVYMFHCHNLVHEDHDMLVAFNVTQLAEWGYSNDTIFIDPMEPEFRPKQINSVDFTTDAILKKLAWFWSTDAYINNNIDSVNSALNAYSTSGAIAPATSTSGNPTLISVEPISGTLILVSSSAVPTSVLESSTSVGVSSSASAGSPGSTYVAQWSKTSVAPETTITSKPKQYSRTSSRTFSTKRWWH